MNIAQGFSFDINAACTGFVYALDIADKYIQSGLVKNASTIDQHLSSFIKYIDAPIFSIDTAFNSNNKLIKKLSKRKGIV